MESVNLGSGIGDHSVAVPVRIVTYAPLPRRGGYRIFGVWKEPGFVASGDKRIKKSLWV